MSVNSRVSPFEVNSLWKTTRREFKTTTAKSNNSDEVNSPKKARQAELSGESPIVPDTQMFL